MKLFVFLSLFIIALTLSTTSGWAQEAMEEGDFIAAPDITLETFEQEKTDTSEEQKPDSSKAEITVIEDKYAGQYVEASLENISKLYWKKNVLSTDNNKAIDNFLMINECDLYTKFYEDDFEWQRIREAAREMISENKEEFSEKFKMVVPIDLGRYDMMLKGFPLINKTAFKDLRRVELGGNSNTDNICNKQRFKIDHYPRNLILILNKPFSFEFVRLDEHVAQAFIIRQKYEKINLPKDVLMKNYDRPAFARFRITFADYQGETKGSDSFPLAIMFGQLDGIDIFEDPGEKRLLTSIDFN